MSAVEQPAEPSRALEDSEAPGWSTLVFRAAVHAAVAIVFMWPLASSSAVLVASLGAGCGAALGVKLSVTRLPLRLLLGGGAALVLLGVLLEASVINGGLFVSTLGPEEALRLADTFVFGLGALGVSGGLNVLSMRRPAFAILEVIIAAMVFAQLVVAHRHGSINRPFDLADPLIAAGEDPTIVFIVLGAGAIALIAMMLMRERSVTRGVLHLAAAAALIALIVLSTQSAGLPAPPDGGGGLGLRGSAGGQQPRGGDGQRNNDELQFQDHDENAQNQAPVAVMLLHDDYSPPSGVYYLRQGAFSQYNGRRLVRASMAGLNRDLVTRFPSARMPIAGAPPTGPLRAPLETTVALLADHTRPPALESPTELSPARNPNPSRFRRVYRVHSAVLHQSYGALVDLPVGDPDWTRSVWEHYTDAPEDERYGELAAQVTGELPPHLAQNMVAKAMFITHWLGQVGSYSTRNGHAGADDPTADFLFGNRTGYCVHFAHAATFMMRSQGIPARVATGYAIDEAARQGGSALLVTGQTSHAWPEVYLAGLGWVPFDVSPQTVLDAGGTPPDPELQRLLGQMLREEDLVPPDQPSRVRDAVESFADTLRAAAVFLLGLGLALLLLASLIKVWRAFAPAVAPAHAQARVRYRAGIDRLAEVGVRRRWGESRAAFAHRVHADYPSLSRLTHEHEGVKYGSALAGQDGERLGGLSRSLAAERAATNSVFRRLRGALNPLSWFWSR